MKKRKFTLKKTALAAAALSLALPLASASASSVSANSISLDSGLKPIRDIAKALGATVEWDRSSGTITLTKGATVLVLRPAASEAFLGGKAVDFKLTGPAAVKNNRTLASEAWILQTFGSHDAADANANDPAAKFLGLLSSGSGDEAFKLMSPALQTALPSSQLDVLWGNYEKIYGKTGAVSLKDDKNNAVHRNVTYSVKADKAPFDITLRLDADGRIDDLFLADLAPDLYRKPSYDQPGQYIEQEITIGEGAFALPGTLTKPAGAGVKGPYPVVVLVQGSGPSDRDASIYNAKPIRDIAVGLAARGIATLRYDKVTYEHTFKVAALPEFTLKNETVDDAIRAVKQLKSMPDIDGTRVFVAGHSQGGFAMPLITAADTNHDIAGTILLEAPSSKFLDAAVLQQEELIKRIKELGQDPAPYEQRITLWKSIAELVNNPEYSKDHLPANFPFPPAYWWYELRDYVPAQLAEKQSGPMLILQGENDWQVTLSEFAGWKSSLAGRKDVEFKSYPKVNHLLAETDVLSTGAEYAQPLNVSEAIINDMADWITKSN
ncbi:alpha/beta fold hydrolase [Paenibacillus caui]|uniref:alpha/beta fold hydrolase n=1 Tax=Paenibacillus caui TaxID=2873927 RepID=UPI001CA89339|nr:alpha/beta fold hydrolase [Paenibacillus caui]